MSGTVYVLECTAATELEETSFYVGYTQDIEQRLDQHFSGRGSNWTQQHPPLRVISLETGGLSREKKKTLTLMDQYGIDRVRGSSWCQTWFSPVVREELTQLLIGEKATPVDQLRLKISRSVFCCRCGSAEHKMADCPVEVPETVAKVTCYRCGRDGHVVTGCRFKYHLDGTIMPKKFRKR